MGKAEKYVTATNRSILYLAIALIISIGALLSLLTTNVSVVVSEKEKEDKITFGEFVRIYGIEKLSEEEIEDNPRIQLFEQSDYRYSVFITADFFITDSNMVDLSVELITCAKEYIEVAVNINDFLSLASGISDPDSAHEAANVSTKFGLLCATAALVCVFVSGIIIGIYCLTIVNIIKYLIELIRALRSHKVLAKRLTSDFMAHSIYPFFLVWFFFCLFNIFINILNKACMGTLVEEPGEMIEAYVLHLAYTQGINYGLMVLILCVVVGIAEVVADKIWGKDKGTES